MGYTLLHIAHIQLMIPLTEQCSFTQFNGNKNLALESSITFVISVTPLLTSHKLPASLDEIGARMMVVQIFLPLF